MELNLYSLYLFFLKLPKILHKGKLCSLFYALSDEAKYPLIVDQRRRKNLEAIDEIEAIANLRELLLHPRVHLEDQVGNGTKVLTFFWFFFFSSVPLRRPKLILVKRNYEATEDKNRTQY